MEIPKDADTLVSPTSVSWLDKDGILCSVSRKGPAPSLEESQKAIRDLREKFGDKKWCLLIDVTHSAPSTKETRDFAAEEIPKIAKAVALISKSPLGRMVANLFFGLKPPSYPTKMFSSEEDAKEWLKQYL